MWGTKLIVPTPVPDRVIWVYGIENNEQFERLRQSSAIPIEFINYIPNLDTDFDGKEKILLILDDVMDKGGSDRNLSAYFTRGCHHKNISVIFVLQNYFFKGNVMRDIHSNTNYVVAFNNPRDRRFITHLAMQSFPGQVSFVQDAYKKACSQPYSYLVFDFTQDTPDEYRLCSNIFPPDLLKIYLP